MLLKIRKGQYISACTGRASVLAWCSPPEHLSSALGRFLSPFSVCTAISCCDCRFRKEWNGCCVSYNWCLIQHEFLLKVFLQLDIHYPKPFLRQGHCESSLLPRHKLSKSGLSHTSELCTFLLNFF